EGRPASPPKNVCPPSLSHVSPPHVLQIARDCICCTAASRSTLICATDLQTLLTILLPVFLTRSHTIRSSSRLVRPASMNSNWLDRSVCSSGESSATVALPSSR